MALPTDAELCERVRDGDRRAAADLVGRHRKLVVGVVRSLGTLPASCDYDDLIQAGSMALLKAADSYRGDRGTRFTTYAYSPVRWAVLDEVAAADPHAVRDADLSDHSRLCESPAPVPAEPPPDQSAVLFAGLAPDQERIVRMAYGIDHEPLSQREIAKRLGVGRSTVRKRLTEALGLIRAALDGTGFDPAAEVAARPPGTAGG